MFKSSLIHGLFIVVFLFALSGLAEATDLGLGIKGAKEFQLNSAVNKPELKFESTAPLEDIVGYVESSKDISSSAMINPANIENSSGMISFKVEGMKTGIDMRDDHLYSSAWLDAKKYPEIKFELKSIKNVKIVKKDASKGRSVAEVVAVGTFMMHGKSKMMEVPMKITYMKESAATQKRAKGDLFFVEGEFKIALADFDVKGSKGVVGSKVGEEIQVAFKLFYNSK